MPPPNLTAGCFLKVDERHPLEGKVFSASGPRTYTRVFLVEMDHLQWGVLEVSLAPGLPSAFSPYVNVYTGFFDGLALLVEADIKRLEPQGKVWEVTCQYSTDLPRGGPIPNMGLPVNSGKSGDQGQGAENNPDLEPPEIEFEFEEVNVPARRDLNERAFVNSAWQPFSPTPTIPYQRAIYTITKNELVFNIELAGLIAGTVNDAEFMGYPRDSVLCMAPKAKIMYKGNFRYCRVTYRLKFGYLKENGEYESFQHEELDQGFRERIPAVDDEGEPIMDPAEPMAQIQEYIPIMDGSKPASKASLLDGNGRKQKKYEAYAVEPDTETDEEGFLFALKPVFIKFKTRRRMNFTKFWNKGFGSKTKKFIGDPPIDTRIHDFPV